MSPSYVCLLPLDAGMCKTYQVRWYFNKYRQRCELFFFGGCGGNANRFDSMHDCKQICLGNSAAISI
ncbi:hypothetical protein CAPTEDRAFT_119124 [Capitella teleta]|uniref:BPTI/Kunitz inhibitor domain-containing protein n=1 Tax=Capitella teleta TaxID=283909 RepID=R7VA77_CAPTE|nr:hypothetical protein CAPTEDRAFT_119124 [Capitella teleta]|eukprot:ELU15519.1 hypothetical protein CAPTEDRAFT_119124 [Capitella teleta]